LAWNLLFIRGEVLNKNVKSQSLKIRSAYQLEQPGNREFSSVIGICRKSSVVAKTMEVIGHKNPNNKPPPPHPKIWPKQKITTIIERCDRRSEQLWRKPLTAE